MDFKKNQEYQAELIQIEEYNDEVTIDTKNDDYEPKVVGTHIKYKLAFELHHKLHELSLAYLKTLKSK